MQETIFNLSIIFQFYNYIHNNAGIVGVPAITVAIM